MIIRQFAVRHGRSAVDCSVLCCSRRYASQLDRTRRALQQPTDEREPQTVIPGHPSESSSILDQTSLPPTRASREAEQQLAKIIHETSGVQAEVNAFAAAKEANQTPSEDKSKDVTSRKQATREIGIDLNAFRRSQTHQRQLSQVGSKLVNVYNPRTIVVSPPRPDEVTLPMLLANQTHLGHATSLWNPSNSSYIFGIRDGIHIISLDITLAYLRRAAKVIREVARRGGIILFVGTRKGQQEIIVNAAKLAGGYHIFDRWVPGTLTNGQQILENCAIKAVDSMDKELKDYAKILANSNHSVMRPDLVVCMNPLENEVCLHECGLYTVPTIGVIDTDANPAWVTYPIPANDDSLRSIALIAGALGRAGQEGQQSRRESAKKGELTFDTTQVQDLLERMTELASIEVQAGGSKDKEKDA